MLFFQHSFVHLQTSYKCQARSKIMQDRYLAKLMARRRIICAICYSTFKKRFSFKEHITSSGYLLAT